MKFKELDIFGFKSFADKTKIKFGSGITTIVGPNGCGKSNVADAIRWVLGEQSAKLLRGKNMLDVIFNGTEKRKSLSYCEVVLYFDNTTRIFPSLDYNEVSISRKLYRSGESSYYINGNPCRLKDIIDLLRDGGLGREGYSIIGQGRIDEILSARPENRRAIFEEAAGVSKYKARKVEAERKLERTRENLVRIDDILAEKTRQLEPLKEQSEKAKKYLELRDKLKHHEINTFIYQRDTSEQAKEQISSRLKTVTEELFQKESEFTALMQEYKSLREQYESSDTNLNALHEQLTSLNVEIEKKAGEIKNLRQRQEFLQQNNQSLLHECQSLKEQNYHIDLELDRLKNNKHTYSEELEKSSASYQEVNQQYLKVASELTERSGKMEEDRLKELEAADKLSEIKSNMSALTAERQMLIERIQQTNDRILEISANNKQLDSQHKKCKTQIDELKAEKENLEKELNQLSNRHNELLFYLNQLSEKNSDLSRQYYSASARLRLLEDMKNSFEGFGLGVKNLLKAAMQRAELSSRIEGTVAQLIKVDKKYETAIEIALGAAFQNVVVPTEEDANCLIDFLIRNKMGRVTFMPMSAAKPRRIDHRFDYLLQVEGCYGVASELISYNPKYKDIIGGYLGGTIIVRDKAVATYLARQSGYAFKIVTLSGEVFSTSGSITGGSLKSDRSVANIFTHEREIRELTPQIQKIKAEIDDNNNAKQASERELTHIAESIKELSKKVHSLDLSMTAKLESLGQLSLDLQEQSSQESKYKEQLQKDKNRLESIDSDLGSVKQLEEFLASVRQKASQSGNEGTQALVRLREEYDSLRAKENQLSIQINKLKSQLEYTQNDIKRHTKTREENQIKINSLTLQIEKNQDLISQIEDEILDLAKKNASEDNKRLQELRSSISGIDDTKKEMAERIAEIDSKREDLSLVLQNLRDKKTNYAFQLQSVDSDIEAKEQKLLEDYNLDYSQCLAFKEEGYDINKGINEINKLRRSITNLGDVNVAAIEQYKEAHQEYEKYCLDREDLVKGEQDLIKIIKDLSADMLKIFNENFEKIRVNFIKIFKELFDGGNANLSLVEDPENQDPLSLGIEIYAQPPQKKLQSISLLSGGERALTAIAIMFAILKLRPMPFCVLDEIEAALDDVNAARFARYLHKFSQETQFIVITHRKPTMEQSDRLYGVTMEEKGVSKIVSVKLVDALAQAENAS